MNGQDYQVPTDQIFATLDSQGKSLVDVNKPTPSKNFIEGTTVSPNKAKNSFCKDSPMGNYDSNISGHISDYQNNIETLKSALESFKSHIETESPTRDKTSPTRSLFPPHIRIHPSPERKNPFPNSLNDIKKALNNISQKNFLPQSPLQSLGNLTQGPFTTPQKSTPEIPLETPITNEGQHPKEIDDNQRGDTGQDCQGLDRGRGEGEGCYINIGKSIIQ